MKHLKIFASLAIICVVIASSAFTKVQTSSVYHFDETLATTDVIANLVPAELNDQAYWAGSAESFGNGTKLAAIDFTEESVADGGSDGALTLQEAIDAVRAYFVLNANLPADQGTISVASASITIRRKL